MKKKGSELEFISEIKRDGSGARKITKRHKELMQDENFELMCLSLSEKTFIAFNFNAYVVKIKS